MVSETDTLKKDVDELRAAIAQITKDLSALSKNAANAVKDDIKANARKTADHAREKTRQSADAVAATVGEYPFRSVLIAFGAGVLMSLLLTRRGSGDR